MSNNLFNLEFYKGKRVLLTGHTGYKGENITKITLYKNGTQYGALNLKETQEITKTDKYIVPEIIDDIFKSPVAFDTMLSE